MSSFLSMKKSFYILLDTLQALQLDGCTDVRNPGGALFEKVGDAPRVGYIQIKDSGRDNNTSPFCTRGNNNQRNAVVKILLSGLISVDLSST